MNLKLRLKFYCCIVKYEVKSCIHPCAQRFYYVDYIKPWIDDTPLNDYVEIEIRDFYKKMIGISILIGLSILMSICIILPYIP